MIDAFHKIPNASKRAQSVHRGVVGTIQEHRTGKPITGGELAKQWQISREDVKAIVNEYRQNKMEICSRSEEPAGYWWSVTPEEVQRTVEHLESRIRAMAAAIRGLKERQIEMITKMPQKELVL